VARESITPAQRRTLQRATLRRAAGLGVGCVHELAGPDISSAEDLRALLALSAEEPGPAVVAYWGELGEEGVARAGELGASGAAGDLFADGSIGSHTAALREPYADADHAGHAYLSAAQVRDHVLACTRVGVQAGFHAIGDGALDAVAAGLAEAAERVGEDRLRAARHRVEHVEMVSPEAIATMARLGVVASVQPAFDRLWGGPSGMYAERLGRKRAHGLNPYAAMSAAGVILALGSDSPVTPIDPWGSVRAAVEHLSEGSGIGLDAAFSAHTLGGWRAAKRDGEGVLSAGAPATFAVWAPAASQRRGIGSGDRARSGAGAIDATHAQRLPDLAAGPPDCLRTVVRGTTVFMID